MTTREQLFEEMHGFKPTKLVKTYTHADIIREDGKPNPNIGKCIYDLDYDFSGRRYKITEAMKDGDTVAIVLELPDGLTMQYKRSIDAELEIVKREKTLWPQ